MGSFCKDHHYSYSSTTTNSKLKNENLKIELISHDRRNTITSILHKKFAYFLDIYKLNRIVASHPLNRVGDDKQSSYFMSLSNNFFLRKEPASATMNSPINNLDSSSSGLVSSKKDLKSFDYFLGSNNLFNYFYNSLFNSIKISTNLNHADNFEIKSHVNISNYKSSLLNTVSSQFLPTGHSRNNFIHNSRFINSQNSQEKYIKILNYYYMNNYQQNIIYLNNLILAIIILFVLFSVLILLEENDNFYNLSAISYLLLVTFNLIIIIFSHNLTKQFLVYNRSVY
jgi:hypothetical protein